MTAALSPRVVADAQFWTYTAGLLVQEDVARCEAEARLGEEAVAHALAAGVWASRVLQSDDELPCVGRAPGCVRRVAVEFGRTFVSCGSACGTCETQVIHPRTTERVTPVANRLGAAIARALACPPPGRWVRGTPLLLGLRMDAGKRHLYVLVRSLDSPDVVRAVERAAMTWRADVVIGVVMDGRMPAVTPVGDVATMVWTPLDAIATLGPEGLTIDRNALRALAVAVGECALVLDPKANAASWCESPIDLDGRPLAAALLFRLATRPDENVPVPELIRHLWPGEGRPSRGVALDRRLRQLISELRARLPEGLVIVRERASDITPGALRLVVRPGAVRWQSSAPRSRTADARSRPR